MKDISKTIKYNGKNIKIVFNLNVMEKIQDMYGTLDKWGELTDGYNGTKEPDAKAVIDGFTEMINEGIDIENEKNGTSDPFLTHRQVGRLLTDIGLKNATKVINDTIIESTKSTEKNA